MVPDFDFPEIGFEKIYGVPSSLNEMLRNGELDLSPVSSMEYLLNPHLYQVLPDICIASRDYANTVGVFSKYEPADWNGKRFFLTGYSLTSIYLFQVLSKLYLRCGVECVIPRPGDKLPTDLKSLASEFDGLLLIGDQVQELKSMNILPYHDLCSLWNHYTGKSFVFALWLVRKDCSRVWEGEIKRIQHGLSFSIQKGLENLDSLFQRSTGAWNREEFEEYFLHSMIYWLGTRELEGLRQFSRDLVRCDLIKNEPAIEFFRPV